MKRKKIIRLMALPLLLAAMLFSLNSCMKFRMNDKKTRSYFKERGVSVNIRHQEFQDKGVRFIESGQNPDNLVIFIHGAPGGADAFYRYLADSTLVQEATLVSVDRLGYGFSDYGKYSGIQVQADLVNHIAGQYPQAGKIILVGHSFGGPIVGKAAMDQPASYDAIIMLAPANDPENEKIFWFSHIGKWKLTRWPLSGALKVSADEKFGHAQELEYIKKGWASLKCKVIHLHGKKDSLVPFQANAEFSKKYIPDSLLQVIELPQEDHFIPWTRYEKVSGLILKALKE